MIHGIAILSLALLGNLGGLIDGGDGQQQTLPTPQDPLHAQPTEIYLDGEWVEIGPRLQPAAHPAAQQNTLTRPARSAPLVRLTSDPPFFPIQPIASETITRGYGIHQINIIRDKFLGDGGSGGGFWTTEIVRPTKPPIIEKPRMLVIERESRGGGGGVERVLVPTTNVEVREFLEGME